MNNRYPLRFITLWLCLIIIGCDKKKQSTTVLSLPPFSNQKSSVSFSDFVGSKPCQSCHPDIYEQWASSTHAKAGGAPTKDRIIAPFNGTPMQFSDGTVYPEIKNGIYQFRIVDQQKTEQVILVEAVVGGGFMIGGGTQTFFGKYKDGSYRFLPFDYSHHESSWFVQLAQNETWVKINPNIPLENLYNWPPHRVLGEIEDVSNCQQCHGSQIVGRKVGGQYDIQFMSLAVNCESCHGPAKRHVSSMSKIVTDILHKDGQQEMSSLIGISKEESLNTCFQCHAVKTPIKPGYLPGEKLESFYSLKMALMGNENPYSIDGRIHTFGYQQNHVFSDCFLSGAMTCTSCHNPHSQDYQDINRVALASRFDDKQCTSCHMAKLDNISAHTFHKAESEGSACISCHMPFRQHPAIGNDIQFTRSDHTIAIPRPAYDASQGFESACQQCHMDRTVDFLQQKVDEWYGPLKPLHPVIANRLKVNENTIGDEANALLLQPELNHPMGQFSNLTYFIKRYLTPGMENLDSDIIEKMMTYAQYDDVDIKALALAGLHYSQYQNPKVQQFITDALKGMGDDKESVRRRWGLILDYFGTVYYLSGDRPRAIICYELASSVLPNDKTITANLKRARS